MRNWSISLKSRAAVFFVAGCVVLGLRGTAGAQTRLPSMVEAPWGGYFSAYERRQFHFGVNDEAQSVLYLIGKDRKRVGETRRLRIYAEVLVETEDGKRTVKRLKNDEGYHSKLKPGLEHKEVTFSATSVGEAKVEMHIQYDGNRVIMDGKILDRGGLKEGTLSFQYKIMVPAMYTDTYKSSSKKEKARMKRDRVRFLRARDGKKVTLKSYEAVDLGAPELAKGGVKQLIVSMDGQEGRDFVFECENDSQAFEFLNKEPGKKGKLWQGYTVIWKRPMGDDQTSPMVIEIK
ncbi:hypothetical protein HW115_01485 [Verrucomicrobiaceae bacterium N1E253]|uniref:Uncharacterized protein n=1 Tax=Oceaniferula marina TaxID=2748318 RepID=A0A851GGJ4_9BACT|nr:hypothetical protein [Oceaniferula marina]NWK54267.1 hypothetical protein [Oceaniferula marina]